MPAHLSVRSPLALVAPGHRDSHEAASPSNRPRARSSAQKEGMAQGRDPPPAAMLRLLQWARARAALQCDSGSCRHASASSRQWRTRAMALRHAATSRVQPKVAQAARRAQWRRAARLKVGRPFLFPEPVWEGREPLIILCGGVLERGLPNLEFHVHCLSSRSTLLLPPTSPGHQMFRLLLVERRRQSSHNRSKQVRLNI